MSLTWTALLADRHRDLAVAVKIEGVGVGLSSGDLTASDGDGVIKWWTQRPSYAAPAQQNVLINREYLQRAPDILSERAPEGGGFPEMGSVEVALVDVRDEITELLRTEQDPIAYLTADMTASATSIGVSQTTDMSSSPPGNVVWIGSEAILIGSKTASVISSLTRGYLQTDALEHPEGTPIWLYSPTIEGRRMQVKVAPAGATDDAQEQLVGEYVIDQVRWDPHLNVWILRGKSELKYLDRLAPQVTRQARVTRVIDDRPGEKVVAFELVGDSVWSAPQTWTGTEADTYDQFYLRTSDGEVVTARNSGLVAGTGIRRRQLAGSQRSEIKQGTLVSQVFVAEESGPCSFRWSPGPSPATARSSGTWTESAHWVDLCLNVMTSPAHSADGITTGTNFNSTYGNWASLPVGFGLGIPHTLIDWDSWLEVKSRTRGARFEAFVYGDRPEPFSKLIDREFLKPMGAYLSFESGKIRCVLPRIPVQGYATTDLDSSDVLTDERARGQRELRLVVSRTQGGGSGAVIYRMGPDGSESHTVRSLDFRSLYAGRSLYSSDERPITVDVPSALPGDDQLHAVLEMQAMRRLLKAHRPRWRLEFDCDWENGWSLHPGDLFTLTLNELPAMDGTRSWSSFVCQVEAREPSTDDGGFVKISAIGYGPGLRIGKIAPAAYVSSVATNTATVVANRYTKSDAWAPLPSTDAAAFEVGDTVQIYALDGTEVSAGKQDVSGISGNDITLDGNFSGSLAAGQILAFIQYSSADAQQLADTVAWSDNGRTAPDPPWRYGEP